MTHAAPLLLASLLATTLPPAALPQQPQAPSWYDHAVIYEIYPRSFQDTNGDGIGDLKGVTQHLDYLQTLGVDAIWLTPFYPSPNRDFGYDISNYTDVAPEYGTMADWDELVRQARAHHIRVLVDFVVNHSSDQHPWFLESRSSRTNPRRDWYIWRDGQPGNQPPTHWLSGFGGYTWTLDPATNQWYYHFFLPQQPDLNWQNPGLRKAMFDVARFWLDHGASGFRLDAVPYLTEDPTFPEDPDPKSGPPLGLKPYNASRPENHEILRQLRSVLDTYPGHPVLLGESLTASIEGLNQVYGAHHDEIQLPMDFLYGDTKILGATHFKQAVDDAESKLGGQTPVFFLSSHDRPRQYSVFGDGLHNDQIAKLTAALTLTLRGTALMYYGEELGMTTTPAPDFAHVPLGPQRPVADGRDGERTPMQWTPGPQAGFTTGTPWLPVQPTAATHNALSEQHDPGSIYAWYTRLLALRHSPVFTAGAYLPLDSGNKQVFAFARKLPDGRGALIVLNMSPTPQSVTLSGFPGPWPHLQASATLASPQTPTPTTPTFTLAPFGTLITNFN